MRSRFFIPLFLLFLACDFDPPITDVPLTGELVHRTNGGSFGKIGTRFSSSTLDVVHPKSSQWHSDIAFVEQGLVIGVDFQYAERAFVDPPVSKRWFCIVHEVATTFETLDELLNFCEAQEVVVPYDSVILLRSVPWQSE